MQTKDVFPTWQLVLIVYGGIGIFIGPLLQLFVYGDQWMLFTILKVVISVTAFFCLTHSIAYAFGNYWIAGVLSIIFLSLFFWRPVGDLIIGPQQISGDLIVMEQIDIYIMRTSHDLEHNVLYISDIIDSYGNRMEIKTTPSELESLQNQAASCLLAKYTVLKNMRKVLGVTCSSP